MTNWVTLSLIRKPAHIQHANWQTTQNTINSTQFNSNTMNNPNEEPLEYNRKWEGYLAILLSSLVNFASVADVSVAGFQIKLQNEKILAVFGAVTFILSLFVFIFDRVKFLHRRFDFKEVWDGRLEGYVLLFFVLWWIVGWVLLSGMELSSVEWNKSISLIHQYVTKTFDWFSVGIMTKADGIAYRVLNTYFSSWYSLFMCIYTLNKWTSAKDIISIKELTQLSKTLPYWYCLLLSSLVEMGSATDVLVTLKRREYSPSKAYYAVIVGTCIISWFRRVESIKTLSFLNHHCSKLGLHSFVQVLFRLQ